MKHTLLPLALLVTSLTTFAAEPAPEPPKPTEIFKNTTPIVIDGKLDDACWQKAAAVAADYEGGKVGVLSSTPRMRAKYTWDDHYLYLAYETFDTNLVALAKDDYQGPPTNRRQSCEIYDAKNTGIKVDVVEFFLSFGDERFFWELHHNALNQFNDVWCVSLDPNWPISKTTMAFYGIMLLPNEWLADDGSNTLAMAVQPKPKANGKPSTVNNDQDVDTGYTAEIRIPLRALGVPNEAATWIESKLPDGKPAPRKPGPWKMAGRTVSVLAVMQDGDLKERYHHSSPTRKPDWFHKSKPQWPLYLFVVP